MTKQAHLNVTFRFRLKSKQFAQLVPNAVITCEIKLFEILLELFQYFISHVTTSETEITLFQPLKLLQNYFSNVEHVGKIYELQ